jgi:hypothetical protein
MKWFIIILVAVWCVAYYYQKEDFSAISTRGVDKLLSASQTSFNNPSINLHGKRFVLLLWKEGDVDEDVKLLKNFEQLRKQYQDKGILFISITKDYGENVKRPLLQIPYMFELAFNSKDTLDKSLGVHSYPTMILVDELGTGRWRGHPNDVSDRKFTALLEDHSK